METLTQNFNAQDIIDFIKKLKTETISIKVENWYSPMSETENDVLLYEFEKISFTVNIHYKAKVYSDLSYDIIDTDIDLLEVYDNENCETISFTRTETRNIEKALIDSIEIELY